ncbi:hypothetical protein CVT26_004018 [Gymnopilus dilepis]|uniref:ABC transporter n=1 Tax=Gymnopilus dilepis TaxID=231916 RepID=A0A409W212_9AGAR|nr:hypothetical protein CVT26_004018 [Gymnopilus dilepis]
MESKDIRKSVYSEKATTKSSQGDPVVNESTKSWFRFLPFFSSADAYPLPKYSVDEAPLIPEANAGVLSLITFQWLSSLLSLGYARPLEAVDLWKLQPDRSAAHISQSILQSFDRRVKEADEYNERLAQGQINPGLKGIWWSITGKRNEKEAEWKNKTGKKKASLVWAMNDSVKWWFWSAGLFKLVGDTAQVTSPLVMKAIITFVSESYYGHKFGQPIPSIGKGVGLSLGLLAMQIIASLGTQQFNYRSASTGVLIRGGMITAIYDRSLRLSSKARSTLTNGKLVNHISTDVSRLDFCAAFFHASWTAPIQLLICLALLIINLGPSALAGFGFFFVAMPFQSLIIKRYFSLRGQTMEWTDKRVKLLQELMGGMKVIKYFAWEVPLLQRVTDYRKHEMSNIRSLLLLRSANSAVAMSLPTIASVLAFVTYSASGHSLNPSVIFTSLTLFNLLRLPLMFLPVSISTIVDAKNATLRLQDVFEADLLASPHETDDELEAAIEVKGASFTWDAPPPVEEEGTDKGKNKSDKKKHKKSDTKSRKKERPEVEKAPVSEEDMFKISDATLSIPRGQLVAIVGPVGSGKSSLLQGLIGEMRKTAGSVTFGGSVAYCPQTAWIQNATIRENICFGRPFDETRYWKAIRDSCLGPDLEMLPNGDLTEVGERGISLSGGQKQRVNICRAIYCDTDIQIFDDPLSALDAHVGKAVFQNVLLSNAGIKTRILVTHALHFLPQVDYIYVVDGGRIAEQGTYTDLMAHGNAFARFMTEFGTSENHESTGKLADGEVDEKAEEKMKNAIAGASLMQVEERNTGAVTWDVYKTYGKSGNAEYLIPLLMVALLVMNGASVISSYWLVWWQEVKWHQPQGFYMGIYAALGVANVIGSFLMGATFAVFTYFSSQRLHKDAVNRVLHAPMSFFETTPLGRIMNRFSKDIDTMDNTLGESFRMVAGTSSVIVGAFILISIVTPWFLIAIVFILLVYGYIASFYRASARELKVNYALLRSSLYSHFAESLSGLATIRAYGEVDRFRKDNIKRMDVENRAYWLTIANQSWLGFRLDTLGACMTFIVSMLTVGTRFSISPAKTGLVLAYVMSIQQAFGWIVRQVAEVENSMNSVERIIYYASEVEQEALHDLPSRKPLAPWPSEGRIQFKDVVLKYRPELPAVLKGISIKIENREKIGIVGRTGAGKSSIMTALCRIVELASGSIILDGVDVSSIGLTDLRSAIAIIPQDPHDDATLWDALKRAHLVDSTAGTSTPPTAGPQTNESNTVSRLDLDTVIEDEGNNLSVGQRSLVSLARALVKNAQIIVLDEATASVDYETDHKIQNTIAQEFKDRTVLCIAHRLRTIISYDRICVLDAGHVAEFDTPTNLYAKPDGIFRGMCERSSITMDDIKSAAKFSN